MSIIQKILFPVDSSPACAAAAPFIKRVAEIYSARLTLLHVLHPFESSVFELLVRPLPDVEADRRALAQERLNAFLRSELPIERYPRIVFSAADAASGIVQVARDQRFNLIAMPTHSGGLFRRMLLGSTTAKVLNDAECPVLTPQHSEQLASRPVDHKEIACSIRLNPEGIRVLRYSGQLTEAAHAHLSIIHVIPSTEPHASTLSDEMGGEQSAKAREARGRIAEIEDQVGAHAAVWVATGQVKRAIIEGTQRLRTDLLVIGRSPETGAIGRITDLTYALVRDSLCPVLSV